MSAAAVEAQLKLQQAQQHAQHIAAAGVPGILQQVSDAIESKVRCWCTVGAETSNIGQSSV